VERLRGEEWEVEVEVEECTNSLSFVHKFGGGSVSGVQNFESYPLAMVFS